MRAVQCDGLLLDRHIGWRLKGHRVWSALKVVRFDGLASLAQQCALILALGLETGAAPTPRPGRQQSDFKGKGH